MSAQMYCKHGVFVGGMGIDWMCLPCEMGDPDMTVNDLLAEQARKRRDLEEWTLFLEDIAKERPKWLPEVPLWTQGLRLELQSLARAIPEARLWSDNDNDDDWLRKRHEQAIRDDRQLQASEDPWG